MANVYVRSGAGGAGTGADWANAYVTLAAALTAKAAGDDFWVSEDHSENQGSAMALTPPGTIASPNRIICVNHSGSVPPVSADLRTTAVIGTNGGPGTRNLIIGNTGSAYYYGIIFKTGIGGGNGSNINTSSADGFSQFENCDFQSLGVSGGNNSIQFGHDRQRHIYINCTTRVEDGSAYTIQGHAEFIGGSYNGAVLPSDFIAGYTNITRYLKFDGFDFSALTGGKRLFGANSLYPTSTLLMNCKLPASFTIDDGSSTAGADAYTTDVVRCDSGATNYRNERYSGIGKQTTETTIVRTGGASDGVTPVAWKFVSASNAKPIHAFFAQPISIWNNTVGSSVTLTLYGVAAAIPNNDDIWFEVSYPNSASFPSSAVATSFKADMLATGAAYSSDGSTWGGSTSPFKMTATFTPQMKGPLTVYVKVGKASSTYYIDPLPVLS